MNSHIIKTYIKSMVCLLMFLVVNNTFYSIDFKKVEDSLFMLNNEQRYNESVNYINGLMEKSQFSEQKLKLIIFKSNTYKRIYDYDNVFSSLNEASALINDTDNPDLYSSKILFEKSLAYFDIHNYKLSKQWMDYLLAESSYIKYLSNSDLAKIKMQYGYLDYLNKDYSNSEKKYNEAIEILAKEDPCNLPMLYVKKIQLYGDWNKEKLMNYYYNLSIYIADSCGILKYKMYAADEMTNVCLNNSFYENLKKNYSDYNKYRNEYAAEKARIKLLDLEIKYEIELNENTIKEQNKTNKLMSFGLVVSSVLMIFILLTSWLVRIKNKRIKVVVEEKNLLYNELTHRVQNNFQTILSVINLQSDTLDEKANEELQKIKGRVLAISSTHDKFMDNREHSFFKSYITNICSELSSVYDENNIANYQIRIEDLDLSSDFQLSIGIITNELLTNFYKHAFSKNSTLKYTIKNHNNKIIINYLTKGNVLKKDENNSLGVKIIEGLVEKLKGAIEIKDEYDQYEVEIIFQIK